MKSFWKLLVVMSLMITFIEPSFAQPSANTEAAVGVKDIKATVPFFLVRHGQTDYNKKNISQGWKDIPLNDVGRAEALKAAQALKGQGIKKIYSSSLSRAKETAEIIRKELGIQDPIIIDPDLRERSWGDLEGKPIEGKNKVNDFNVTPPGGEAADIFRERVDDAFLSIINKNEDGVLIVSHGGSMRMFFEFIHYKAGDIKNAMPVKVIPPTKEWKVEIIGG